MKRLLTAFVDKPHLLRSMCDELKMSQCNELSPTFGLSQSLHEYRSHRECGCRLQEVHRSVRHKKYAPARQALARKMWNIVWHNVALDHRGTCSSSVNKWGRGFTFSYCGPLLAGVIRFMYWSTSGAGGAATGPVITTIPVVPSDSPAFSLVDIALSSNASAEDIRGILTSAVNKLRGLIAEVPHPRP